MVIFFNTEVVYLCYVWRRHTTARPNALILWWHAGGGKADCKHTHTMVARRRRHGTSIARAGGAQAAPAAAPVCARSCARDLRP